MIQPHPQGGLTPPFFLLGSNNTGKTGWKETIEA